MNNTTYYLQITPDLLQATLLSTEAGGEAVRLSSGEDLNLLLAQKEIIHGLDQAALARAAACIDRGKALPGPLVLASGSPPILGRQGILPRFSFQPLMFEETDENGQTVQIEVLLAPLVRPGDIIAENGPRVPPVPGINIHGKEISCPFPSEQTLQPGDNVAMDEEKQQLMITASGYPVISSTKKGSIEQLTLGVEKLIRVTPDRMQAFLYLKPAPTGFSLPDADTLKHILDEENITFGLLPHAIAYCLENCKRERRPQQTVIVQGTLPLNGNDALLRFEIETGPLPGKIMGNGDIDFRERNMFIGVDKDQLIAVRIPPTPGTPGRDIFGAPVPQAPGKDIAIKVADDVAYNEETGEIRAKFSGVLSMVGEGSVKVCSRQVISQDIDFETGNIVSRSALEIKGSIKPKFRVNALGDILIQGNIEKAQIRSDGNVIVQAGMIGDMSAIHARGDVDIQFVESGEIFAGGAIILRKNAYYCRMHAHTHCHCVPFSRIITSQLVAAGSITVGTVGSDNADPSLLAAAVWPEQLQLFFELRRTIAAQTEAIEALQRRIGQHAGCEELDELVDALAADQKLYNRLNLIFPEAQMPADGGLSHALGCSIVVKGKVFAGTEIRIGNSRTVLETTMANVCFRLRDHTSGGAPSSDGILILPNKK